MTEESFRAKRRQAFLTEKYFKLNARRFDALTKASLEAIEEWDHHSEPPGQDSIFQDKLNLLRLHYTAGEPIETLKPLYGEALAWFGKWHIAYRQYIHAIAKEQSKDLREDGTPVWFEDLFSFQLGLDVVSLGVLLGEGDAVREAADWLARYRHTDMMFEAIVEPAFGQASTVEEFFHEKPYDPLLDAIYAAETPEEASAYVKSHLDGWYKSFEGASWHAGHTIVTDEYMAYEGYWAFEAAAVCVIYGIDDSSFRDHLVYPKDLADWARRNHSLDKIRPRGGDSTLRHCKGGDLCPREGWWFTPAHIDSRRHFESGQVMPNFQSDYGKTIWQWDQNQTSPDA